MANRKKRLEREQKRLLREQQLSTVLRKYKVKKNAIKELAFLLEHWNGSKKDKRWKAAKRSISTTWNDEEISFFQNYLMGYSHQKKEALKAAVIHKKLQNVSKKFFQSFANILRASERVFRKVEDWKPTKSSNEEIVFQDLFEHLFVGYKVNRSIFQLLTITRAFYHADSKGIQLLMTVAAGKGIHAYKFSDVKMTKKMNFFFGNAPEKLGIYKALAWSKYKGIGADDKLALCLANKSFNDFEQRNWMSEFIHFANKENLSDSKTVKKILEFVDYQLEFSTKEIKKGMYTYEVPPLFRGFNFKGRTLTSVLRMCEEWEQHIADFKRTAFIRDFPEMELEGFRHETNGGGIVYIKRLNNPKQLIEEARYMKHCVAKCYQDECMSGESSIWSLKLHPRSGNTKRVVTIELQHEKETIRFGEVQGKTNVCPPQYSVDILKKWGEKIGVKNASDWKYWG